MVVNRLTSLVTIMDYKKIFELASAQSKKTELNIFTIDSNCHLKKITSYPSLSIVTSDPTNFNVVILGYKNRFYRNSQIVLTKDNFVFIGISSRKIRALNINCDIGASVVIGDDFSCHGVDIESQERALVRIGTDCQFSREILIRNGDGHPIYQSGKIINRARAVCIGNHVWVGQRAVILKGSKIPSGSIVGCASVVTKDFSIDSNIIIAGNPARKVKENIHWTRDLLSRMDDQENSFG